MVLLDIDDIMYHEVLGWSKSVGTSISPLKLCIYYAKHGDITAAKI